MTTSARVSLDYQEIEQGGLRLVLAGTLDVETTGQLWTQVVRKVSASKASVVEVAADGLQSCDAAGFALLLELKRRQEARGRGFRIQGLRRELADLMALFDPGPPAAPAARPGPITRQITGVGR